MDEPRSEAGTDSARRLQLHGRTTRALIANYIHELYERHGDGAARAKRVIERDPKEALR